jgi:signal transduction histidine kinase
LNRSPVYDEGVTFQFYISVETPVTERKENERKILAQHTALQRVGWLNSHELRGPLCSIIGLISVLINAEDKNERSDCLAALEACAKELGHLLKDINQNFEHLELIEGHQAS